MTLDNYSGHTTAIYQHDAATPTTFKGGDIVIGKAVGTENVFTLFTDANGVTAANQDTVLNALANKLTYKNFADGKLKGKLAIGEGLTPPPSTRTLPLRRNAAATPVEVLHLRRQARSRQRPRSPSSSHRRTWRNTRTPMLNRPPATTSSPRIRRSPRIPMMV